MDATTTTHVASPRARTSVVAGASSWMALVAATTIGLSAVSRLRAEVSVRPHELGGEAVGEYRLVVQAYTPANMVGGVPAAHARPLASAQRSVTPDELTAGVAVDVVELGDRADSSAVLVAWLERGTADLDFDGRKARPSRGAYVGAAASNNAQAQIVLQRQPA